MTFDEFAARHLAAAQRFAAVLTGDQTAVIEPKTVMHMLHKHRIVWACYQVVGWSPTTTSVGWLPPTSHNLALLKLTPPAGFSQVSNQQIAKYLGPYS